MAAVLRADGLVKTFGRTRALDHLDLDVEQGEVHGFLGPNGSGKSTTIRVLLGLVRADGGVVEVLGLDPWSAAERVHRDVAYVPGDVALWPGLTGGETIDLLTGLHGGADPGLRAMLLDAFDLDPRTRARGYSKGNRQKVALVAAFSRRARLYVLDEPTSGLDPVMEEVFGAQVRRVRDDGASVLLSSHILSEAEQLCDRVTIIRAGVRVEHGSLAELRHLTRTSFTVSTVGGGLDLAGVDGVHDLRATTAGWRFGVDASALPAVLTRLATQPVSALQVEPPSLEELFLSHYAAR
jgi:ABC-2 type transport system ATP-binding protein